ncbi:MAG: Gfo/Idh/MocA family oxidoreductase [Kiritimatiellae bacterium]|nr:Gfo/Idh/MocA family oxidoreductase [Kiritimatiellia bacterium]
MFNRRQFLTTSAAAAFPFIIPSRVLGAEAPSKLVRVGIIGCGRISTGFEIPNLMKQPGLCRIVAVCDLDEKRLLNAKEKIETGYRKGLKIAGYTVATYKDYRELCASKDVDAVMVCTPDFWHALCAAEALCNRKALWLQKPFTQTIREGRLIANLAKKYNAVVQVGSQQRSDHQFREACEIARNGLLGKVTRVEVGIACDKPGGSDAVQPVPSTFDYATWLGPTDPTAPYCESRTHSQSGYGRPGWITMAPYGWGMITNWGAHHIDIMQWGLGTTLTGPTQVSGTCEWMDRSGGKLWNVHTGYDLHYTYGDIDVHLCNKYWKGVKFIGEKGDWIFVRREMLKKVTSSDGGQDDPSKKKKNRKPRDMRALISNREDLLARVADWNSPLLCLKDDRATKLKVSTNHFVNWLEAVRAEDPSATVTNAEEGHRSTSACSLGHMVMELGRGKAEGASITWDPVKETTGRADADALMTPFARDQFDLRKTLARFGLDFDREVRG